MMDPFAPTWVVMADVGTEFPEVFGPFSGSSGHEDARRLAEELIKDDRVTEVGAVALISPGRFWDGSYWPELEEAIGDA